MKRPLKLITALGQYPDLILEVIDFFNGGARFAYNQEANSVRRKFQGRELTEIHLICTLDVTPVLRDLKQKIKADYPALDGHVHGLLLDCEDICCAVDDNDMRRLVNEAVRQQMGADLIIASGGRKQVTQRLVEAGLLYGCRGYLTITAPRGRESRRESASFHVLLTTARQFSEERRGRIIHDEPGRNLGDNFRSLYLLPAMIIDRLQQEGLGRNGNKAAGDIAWLQRLPKADLHCHLGGAYDAPLLKEMAANLLDDLEVDTARRQEVRQRVEGKIGKVISALKAHDLKKLRQEHGGQKIVHALQNLDFLLNVTAEPKYIAIAILVDTLSVEQVQDLSCDGREKADWPRDLGWYMACGDLGGSALLQTERNLRRALVWLMDEARAENVFFMEVRFSPDNYTRGGLSIRRVIDTLLAEAREYTRVHKGFQVNFLIMATRHKDRAAMITHVAAAVSYGQSGKKNEPRVTGFDLAGQEEDNDPAKFKDVFMPLHYHFINITIHAGEMAEADKIWQALYDLHAKRIGHGLKLINNAKMMDYVRDYGIAIEMCPSSNSQTNGFRRFDREEEGKTYPLKAYMERGVAVTINTDNRGISDTTLANEYLEAARLTRGGLSKWEILRLVKNGFKAAFLPKDDKDILLKEMDERIFKLILAEYYPE